MADKDLEGDGPSLELPSFGFGRRKRGDRSERAETAGDPEAVEPDATATTETAPQPPTQPQPREQPTHVQPPAPSSTAPATTAPATTAPSSTAPSSTAPATTAPERRRAPVPPAMPAAGDTPARTRLDEHEDEDEDEAGTATREIHFPTLPALPAVLLVGAVVGLAAVLLTWGSLRLCDVATGTASCGGGPGLLLLVAIMIALTYLGGWLLRGFGISDAGSTSFLAVGLLAVVAMLFLVDSLDEWTGALAVPVVTVLAYALSWRVTATLVDAGADQQ